MTKAEKRIFLLGTLAGVLVAGAGIGVMAAHRPHSMSEMNGKTESKSSGNVGGEIGTEPGTEVQLTPEEMQAAGIEVAEVKTARLQTGFESFGRVEEPESQLAAVSARIGGRVDKLYVNYTGEAVRRGQPVAEIYSPEVASAVEEYRLAQQTRSRLSQSGEKEAVLGADQLTRAAERKLELWGISEKQARSASAGLGANGIPHVTLYANAGGLVMQRKVTQGQYINAGDTLLTLADLGEVWIKADVYEEQLAQVRPGEQVEIRSDALPDQVRKGRVDFIEPAANPQTRTVPVHVHVSNPGRKLLPGMFVRANFIAPAERETVVAPRSAVIDTGKRKLVYVSKENGVFEAREVDAGDPVGDVYPINAGLKLGEKIVVHGNFLVDSQTRLTAGMSGMYGGAKASGDGSNQQQGTASVANTPAPKSSAKLTLHVVPDPPKAGEESMFHVTLSEADGKAIRGAEVKLTLQMPAMPAMNMPEMKTSAKLPEMDGMYMGKATVPMSGTWNVLIEARKGGERIAILQTHINAR